MISQLQNPDYCCTPKKSATLQNVRYPHCKDRHQSCCIGDLWGCSVLRQDFHSRWDGSWSLVGRSSQRYWTGRRRTGRGLFVRCSLRIVSGGWVGDGKVGEPRARSLIAQNTLGTVLVCCWDGAESAEPAIAASARKNLENILEKIFEVLLWSNMLRGPVVSRGVQERDWFDLYQSSLDHVPFCLQKNH